MSHDFCPRRRSAAIPEALGPMRFDSPYGKDVERLLRHGIGLHHAGLLPKYRLLVEKLAQKGLLTVISGTDTLGVGVNIPIRTVLFTQLCKFDGEKTGLLSVFATSSRSAGEPVARASTIAEPWSCKRPSTSSRTFGWSRRPWQTPAKKSDRWRKPPDKGYVHWDRATFDRLATAIRPSPCLALPGDPRDDRSSTCSSARAAGARPWCSSCGTATSAAQEARATSRSGAGRCSSPARRGRHRVDDWQRGRKRLRVDVDLQDDFSLNHALSLWLLDTHQLLERESPSIALDSCSPSSSPSSRTRARAACSSSTG